MNSKAFLVQQLDQTAKIIEWIFTLLPKDRLNESPPHNTQATRTFLGEWSALRVLFHLLYYEETIALPSLKYWVGDPVPTYPKSTEEEEAWNNCEKNTGLLARFLKIREKQIEIINRMDLMDWEVKKLEYYGHGKVSAYWFVAKTIQHTFSHGDKLLRKGLYWDDLDG